MHGSIKQIGFLNYKRIKQCSTIKQKVLLEKNDEVHYQNLYNEKEDMCTISIQIKQQGQDP